MTISSKHVISSIAGSTFFKFTSALVSFISVPLLLKTLGTEQYGIWVTLTALVAWLNLFDFGSGYSLKNKVTEAIANDDIGEIQSIVAGTIQFYLLVTILILLCFLSSLFFVPIFREHLYLSLIIYLPIIFSFPFTLGHFIIQGLKKFNLFNFILLAQTVIWLLIVIAFQKQYFAVNIYKLAGYYSILFAIANVTIMITSLRNINFRWGTILDFENFKSSKASLLVGTKFFVLQISSLFLYSLGNILTYNNLKLVNVAQYDTVNKIYMMGMTIFNVIITVFWTEISQEKALGNKTKLLKLYRQLLLLSTLFSLGCLIVTFMLPGAVVYWTKNIIRVNVKQLVPFYILVSVQAFAYSGAVFLNAFEQLKGQIVLSFFAAILIIPLANILFKINFGIGTVPMAAAILTFPTLVYVIFKAYRTINNLPL